MRVTIDGTSLLLRSAGVKNYFYYWVQHLRRAAGDVNIGVFPMLGELGSLTHEASVWNLAATIPRLGLLYLVNIPGNPAIDWVLGRTDLFHISNQVRNPPRTVPLTATLHDLTSVLMPEVHTAANVVADRAFFERAVAKARRIIAVSENTRADAVRLLGLNPDRVEVIYHGVPPEYFEIPEASRLETARRLGLDRPYVLYVGTIEPRKNLDGLLDGWAALSAELRENFTLAVAGPVGWKADAILARLQSAGPGVRYLGYVPERDLPALTAGATVFAYPSLYEGFGLPVAQAMAAGVPVVTSSVSSLPEIGGEAALLADPRSPAEIGGALARLLESPDLRAKLGACGAQRARAMFRWEENARRSLEFFRRAMA